MSKIDLSPVAGGFNLFAINDNFQKIATALNDQVLYRDLPESEPNQMITDLDMNGQRIYNLPVPTLDHEAMRWKEGKSVLVAALATQQSAEAAEQSAIVAQLAREQAVFAKEASDINASTSANAALAAYQSQVIAEVCVLDAEAARDIAGAYAAQAGVSATAAVNAQVLVAADALTVSANTSTVVANASLIWEAQAQTNALLGLGIGGSYVNPEGDLIMTYNSDTVTDLFIDANGNLTLEY